MSNIVPVRVTAKHQLQNQAAISAAEAVHASDVAGQRRLSRNRPAPGTTAGKVPTAPHVPVGTAQVALPPSKPVVHPGAGAPARVAPVASVGPGSTRSATPNAVAILPKPAGRAAPQASVGAGQGKITADSIKAAIASARAK